MKIYKEIKEIAKCNSKIERLTDRLSERFDVGEDIEWNTAIFVSMKDKDLKRLDLVDDDYYCDQHVGYLEDDFYGWLYFKTDVPGQYVRVHFQCW